MKRSAFDKLTSVIKAGLSKESDLSIGLSYFYSLITMNHENATDHKDKGTHRGGWGLPVTQRQVLITRVAIGGNVWSPA